MTLTQHHDDDRQLRCVREKLLPSAVCVPISKPREDDVLIVAMQAKTARFIAYFRVSTARQGRSGLGLEAQQEAVRQYLTSVGGTVAAEFTEVETGKRNARPELAKALAACKRLKAKLVIAKLDRLSRNVAFLSAMTDGRTEFVACDNPTATLRKARSSSYVYAIIVDDVVRYVGKGRDKRLYTHLIEARRTAARCGVHTSHLYPRMHRKLVEAVRAGSNIAEIIISDCLTDRSAFRLEYQIICTYHKNRPGQLWNTIDERFMDKRFIPKDWHNPENPLYRVARAKSV